MDRRELLSLGVAAVLPGTVLQNTARAQQTRTRKIPVRPVALAAAPVPMAQVRLLPGPFLDSQRLNARFLNSIAPDRLLHNFRVNAGLPSAAQPLGGWEKPDCELRGHFTGHALSAYALLFASTGDETYRARGLYLVAELAKCQQALKTGYLSAFPITFFDRLDARTKVWAPFYTIHKIMAGMLDMHQLAGSAQALEVLEGMANWTDRWSEPLSTAHMQDVLGTEFGGMAETLFSLAILTGDARYAAVGDRFEKRRFLDPLAQHRDELKGLHVNTHIPQVIGAARRYEATGDAGYRNIAQYFWREVTTQRAYCTGGTSNNESWLTGPGRLAEELPMSTDTAECCVAYNMLKLTRKLYQWTADPRYFDYYERVLFNHRLGTLDPETGSSMYYFPLHAASWKVFGSNFDSCWCCTGSGVEEHAKLNDSIYFEDGEGIFVNLFIASGVTLPARGIRLTQQTRFPDEPQTTLTVHTSKPAEMTLRVRVPHWLAGPATVSVNGKKTPVTATRGEYVALRRVWRDGDSVVFDLPMALRTEPLPDDAQTLAVLAGPIVLAGQLGSKGLTHAMCVNHEEPGLHEDPKDFLTLACDPANPQAGLQPVPGRALTYRAGDFTLAPLNRTFDERYAVYWRVKSKA